jgi:CopG-like RHH_1 or ribbon-helix-helix domain, RHH_5
MDTLVLLRCPEVPSPIRPMPRRTLEGMTEPKMERLVATVPASLLKEVRRRAQAEDRPVSSIVRLALKAYLEDARKRR